MTSPSEWIPRGERIVIATMHQKEPVIAPILERELHVRVCAMPAHVNPTRRKALEGARRNLIRSRRSARSSHKVL